MATITLRSTKGSPLTNNEVDANFTNLNTDKAELSGATFTGNLNLGDNVKATFNSNLNIFSTGTSSYIEEVGAGDLYLKASNLYITDRENNQFISMIDGGTGGTVFLKHNGSDVLQTTSTGADITGVLTADGLTVDGNVTFNTDTLKISDNIPKLVFEDTDTSTLASITANSSHITYATVATSRDHIFKQGGTTRMVIDDTGIDVTGQATMDGLSVDGVSNFNGGIDISSANTFIYFMESDTANANTLLQGNQSAFSIKTVNDAKSVFTERFKISHSTGDIGFYEDTGTTAKLFWDASAESLGIGDSNPSYRLDVNNTSSRVRFKAATGNSNLELSAIEGRDYLLQSLSDGRFRIYDEDASAERLTINADGSSVFSGAVTSTGLTVNGNTATFSAGTSGDMEVVIEADTDNNNEGDSTSLVFKQDGGNTIGRVGLIGNANDVFTGSLANALYIGNDELANLQLYTNLKERIRISSNGDISFYNDSANQGLFWDSSTSRLGLGITNPLANLDISSATTSTLRLSNTDTILTENQVTGQLEFYQSDASNNGTGITGKIGMRSVPQKPAGGNYYGNVADMDFYVSGQLNGYANDNASLKAMTIQAGSGNATFSGSVGIGVTPSAWADTSTALQIGSLALEDYTVSGANVSVFYNNAFRNTSGNIVYKETDFASTYSQYNGEHTFSVAPSGTAGATISLTQALKISSSANVNIPNGSLMVGATTAPDRKLHVKDSNYRVAVFERTGSPNGYIVLKDPNTTQDVGIGATTNDLKFRSGNVDNMSLSSTGNVNIPNGGLMIGATTAPSAPLHILGSSSLQTAVAKIVRQQASASNNTYTFELDSSAHVSNMSSGGAMAVDVNSGRAFTINGLGNVGIGTSNPATLAHLYADNATLTIQDSNNFTDTRIKFLNGSSSIMGQVVAPSDVAGLEFYYGTLEAMRISSDGSCRWTPDGTNHDMTLTASGNLLVGKTAVDTSTAGIELRASNLLNVTRTGGQVLQLNRLSSDGEIAKFLKDGSTVGSIGTFASDITIGKTGAGLRFEDGTQTIRPHNISTNTGNDANVTLGNDDTRFKDLYLSGGVYLGGTGSANKLDDYEEGTWTPVVGGTWTTSPTTLSGTYTKVGNVVTIRMRMLGGVKSSAVSGYITGLPFATNNSYGSVGSVSNTGVADFGNCLFQNTDRIWFTETNFATGTVWVSGVYETTV